MTAPTCLQGLYGDKTRLQETFTPPSIYEQLINVWGRISLDPCGHEQSPVPAERVYLYPAQDGLALPWADRTYINPPFKDLKVWLAKAVRESQFGYRLALLAPVRTHRKWFRAAMDTCDTIWLDPIKFWGHTNTFPAPLCLMYWPKQAKLGA